MQYDPRTYIQDLANEAAAIVTKLGKGWSHEGAIIRHESGAVILLLTQVAVAPENVRRVNIEGMTQDEIVKVGRSIAPETFWLTEYGSDEGGWAPTYYHRHDSAEAAERYAAQTVDFVDGDLRISKVIAQVVAVHTK